ncbi:PX domain-containing protein EREL2-like [Rutidosis leptorrhynchoides]|uniref:PX domain-containing protein EREL2-like n=1 Tax=Rutidosis leptorrhynchoides TaxID=125765 RepID=UPI003A999D51
MDWSLPPRIWEGRNSVWPHESNKRWSYCVTVPSWTVTSSANGSDTVCFRVQVGIQSPEGITSTREVLRRFNEFLQLYSELRKQFPKKDCGSPKTAFENAKQNTFGRGKRRCALDGWLEKLLSDIDVSRTAYVAIFLELEAAERQACTESTQNDLTANSLLGSSSSVSSDMDNPSTKGITIDQNDMLQNELIDAKEDIGILPKSNSELKRELSKCLEENKTLEKEKQIREAENVLKLALLRKCALLCNRLRDCSINFVLDDEDKLMADTSLSDAVDLLETSDSQINLLPTEFVVHIGRKEFQVNPISSEMYKKINKIKPTFSLSK